MHADLSLVYRTAMIAKYPLSLAKSLASTKSFHASTTPTSATKKGKQNAAILLPQTPKQPPPKINPQAFPPAANQHFTLAPLHFASSSTNEEEASSLPSLGTLKKNKCKVSMMWRESYTAALEKHQQKKGGGEATSTAMVLDGGSPGVLEAMGDYLRVRGGGNELVIVVDVGNWMEGRWPYTPAAIMPNNHANNQVENPKIDTLNEQNRCFWEQPELVNALYKQIKTYNNLDGNKEGKDCFGLDDLNALIGSQSAPTIHWLIHNLPAIYPSSGDICHNDGKEHPDRRGDTLAQYEALSAYMDTDHKPIPCHSFTLIKWLHSQLTKTNTFNKIIYTVNKTNRKTKLIKECNKVLKALPMYSHLDPFPIPPYTLQEIQARLQPQMDHELNHSDCNLSSPSIDHERILFCSGGREELIDQAAAYSHVYTSPK